MIQLLIFWYLSVVLDDLGHATLSTAGYILTVIFGIMWLLGVIVTAANASDE
jgi:hypothetical protein